MVAIVAQESVIRDKNTLRKILRVVPDRVHTIIPGMLILDTIIRYFDSEVIFISNYGVREGYLYSKVLGEEWEYGEQEGTWY